MSIQNHESVHLWVCDSEGDIHVLCHVTSTEDRDMKWREVDGEMDHVISGTKGLVCGIDATDRQLHVRVGVAWDTPLGKKWAVTGFKDIEQLAVGGDYLSIWQVESGVLIGNVNFIRSHDFCPIQWGEVADATPIDLFKITMSIDDVLYGVTKGGVVYGCYGIKNPDQNLHWEELSKPPPIARRGLIKSFLFKSQPIFHDIGANTNGVWCYSQDKHEVWYLSIKELPSSSHRHMCNWTRYSLPPSVPQLSTITCHPTNLTIYGISVDETGIYQLDVEGLIIRDTELPFHGCGDITMTTLSCSLVRQGQVQEEATPSIYPKLPKLSLETENTFYTNSYNTGSNIDVTFTSSLQRAGIKRRRDDDEEFAYLSPCEQATPSTKRRRTHRRCYNLTHRLIKDIPIIVLDTPPPWVIDINLLIPSFSMIPDDYLQLPHDMLTPNDIEKRFHHSFELEDFILEESFHSHSGSQSHSGSLSGSQSQYGSQISSPSEEEESSSQLVTGRNHKTRYITAKTSIR